MDVVNPTSKIGGRLSHLPGGWFCETRLNEQMHENFQDIGGIFEHDSKITGAEINLN
jgi:hypothetical protein